MIDDNPPTVGELAFRRKIFAKDAALRTFLDERQIEDAASPRSLLVYLIGIKDALGNISNDIGFVATLLIKAYLRNRFGITDFDAGGKAQGAPGIDVVAQTAEGLLVVGELKTTKPYQPGFGAQQRMTMLKDLDRLQRSAADYKLMFVTDPETFNTLCAQSFAARAPSVEIVNLITGQSSRS